MSSGQNGGGFLDRLTIAEKFIALVSGGAIAWTTFQSHEIANAVNQQAAQLSAVKQAQDMEIERQKSHLERRGVEFDLTHRIYDEFVEAIVDEKSTDAARIDRLHAVLVLTAAIPDPEQREGMVRAVKGAIERKPPETPQLRQLVEAAAFDAETAIARAGAEQKMGQPAMEPSPPQAANAPRWSNYDFDVFWCEAGADPEARKEQAGSIAALRAADPNAAGNWRVRPLPEHINARVGYQVSGYQIRYSSDDELPFAQALRQQIMEKLSGVDPQIVRTAQESKWYLSVFVCPK